MATKATTSDTQTKKKTTASKQAATNTEDQKPKAGVTADKAAVTKKASSKPVASKKTTTKTKPTTVSKTSKTSAEPEGKGEDAKVKADKPREILNIRDLEEKTLAQLREQASEMGVGDLMELPKRELILEILKVSTKRGGYIHVEGVLEVMSDNTHGVLRTNGVSPSDNDVYISGSQIKKFNLRTGDLIAGPARLPKGSERYLGLLRVQSVYGRPASEAATRTYFSKMTPIYPDRQIKLETEPSVLSTRIMDLLAPIGFGQRSLIVAPPKAGKTTLLKEIANGVTENHPEAKLIVVLVGERPEEVTDIERSVKGDVYASNFDQKPEHNTKVAEMALEAAQRMVEFGEDVVMLMDSVTRLARAYNITMPSSGRTLSGGFDPVALYPPKRFFGAARNFEEKGSLTIIATALVETGSRMDDLVYEEFKGTGNMELHLDRKLQQKRVFPAIDVVKSGTRNEDKLLEADVLNQSWRIRHMLEMLDTNEHPSEVLIERMRKTKDNKEFLATLHEAV